MTQTSKATRGFTRGALVTVQTAGAGTWRGVVVRASGALVTVRVTGAPDGVRHVIGQDREVPRSWVSEAPMFTALALVRGESDE